MKQIYSKCSIKVILLILLSFTSIVIQAQTATLLSEDFEAITPGTNGSWTPSYFGTFSSFPYNWFGVQNAGYNITNNSMEIINYTSNTTANYGYATQNASNTNFAPLIFHTLNTTGLTNIKISYDWICNGETGTYPGNDYGFLVFRSSTNGWYNWDVPLLSATTTQHVSNLSLPDGYSIDAIGWEFVSNQSIVNQPGLTIDNIVITGDTLISSISTSPLLSNNVCQGSNIVINFTTIGSATDGNYFTAQLSDASGSFSSPTDIGTRYGNLSNTIYATIPSGTVFGTNYRVRVVSGNPGLIGSDNGTNITINSNIQPSINIVGSDNNICSGKSVTFTAYATNGGNQPIYQWIKNNNVVGNNTITYTDAGLANGDNIYCNLIADNTCQTSSSVISNNIVEMVNPAIVSTTNATIYPTDLLYIWNGLVFNTRGTQTAHLTNAMGCDSFATLNLTVVLLSTSVTSFSPVSATTGTTITIKGTNLTGITGVSFGATAASSFVVLNDTTITAIVDTGSSGNVIVTTSIGTASLAGFTYIVGPPTITSFAPMTANAGTTVTLMGLNFTNATSVSFGGIDASSFTVLNSTTITAVVGSGGSGSINVTTPNGTNDIAGFSYYTAILIPFSGSNTILDNATLCTHAGCGVSYNNNADGYTVLNGVVGKAINIVGDYSTESCCDNIIIYSGVGTAGTILATYKGTGYLDYTGASGETITVRFTSDASVIGTGLNATINYIIPLPLKITSFTPTLTGTGAVVTISGTSFTGATSVSFGGTNAISFSVINSTTINAVVSNGTSGSIKVTSPNETDSLSGYLYDANLTSFIPYSGYNYIYNNNTLCTHAGCGVVYNNYANGYTVLVGSTGNSINIAGNYSTESSYDYVYIYSGVGTSGTLLASYTGTGSISYTGTPGQTLTVRFTSDGSVTSAGLSATINYQGPPTINSFTPTSALSGTTITIKGTKFTGATSVSFGGTAASSYIVVNDSIITAIIGEGTSGNISVTTSYGTSSLAGFTYLVLPIITSFTPTTASTGIVITISGTNLTGASSVSFGGTAASSFTVVNDNTITATVGAGTSGSVSVTTNGGTANLTGFNYFIQPTINTVAGNGVKSFSGDGSNAINAGLSGPQGLVFDAVGNYYILDGDNNRIRKVVVSTGVITTIAGNGSPNSSGDGGQAVAAGLSVYSIALDNAGNIFVADSRNSCIRKITVSTGIISTIAGNGIVGYNGDGGLATAASLNSSDGIAVDADGNVYISDYDNNRIRKINSATGIITTIAGTGTSGYSGDGGSALAAKLYRPAGIVLDKSSSNLYIADYGFYHVRKLNLSTGIITTVAGIGSTASSGDGGLATSASLIAYNLALDSMGNLYIADAYNNNIRKITMSTGIISTVAGNGTAGFSGDGGSALLARMSNSFGVALDSSGSIYIADVGNNRIRKVSILPTINLFTPTTASIGATILIKGFNLAGVSSVSFGGTAASSFVVVNDTIITAVVGTGASGSVSILTGGGNVSLAGFTYLTAPNISYAGGAKVYTIGTAITTLSPVNSGGTVTGNGQVMVSTFAGSGSAGSADGLGVAASFNGTSGAIVDASGNVYVGDQTNNKIRKISPMGLVSTLAGSGINGSSDGQGSAASFNSPSGVAIDAIGNVYVADVNNHKIRKISPAGLVSTLAGSGIQGSLDGQGSSASFAFPSRLAVDASGNVYVADANNNKIRKISPIGLVSTLAGNGSQGSSDGQGSSASFSGPRGIALDASGNMYVGDANNNKIRKISPIGLVSTFAGNGSQGSSDGQGSSASFSGPRGIALDASGNVYVGDAINNKIRKISPTGLVSTLAGSGSRGSSEGQGSAASFNVPFTVTIDSYGNAYVADYGNNKIRKITPGFGYTISPSLPLGLSFDGNTGTISGIPTVNTTSTTYTIIATNMVGSSTTTVSIAICANTSSVTNVSVCSSELPFNWNGIRTVAGTYTYITTNSQGCDSVATLNLMVKNATTSTSNATACGSYFWNGSTYTTSGVKTKTFIGGNSIGCDSTATLNLIIKAETSSITNASFCYNSSYFFGGAPRYLPGTYIVHSINAAGCDSTATLNLTLIQATYSNTDTSVCASGLPFVWNGVSITGELQTTFTKSVANTPVYYTYLANLINVAGCDSLAYLNLTVKTASNSTTNVSICPSLLPYNWNGNRAIAGTYIFTTTNSQGCDSVATLNLVVKENSSSVTNVSICPSALPYNWNGSRSAAGIYTFTTTNSMGCDSVATLNLTVKENSSSVTNVSICPSALPFSWNGSRASAGTYTFTTTNSQGCDSVATLNLVVKENSSSVSNVSICPSALPYNWNGSRTVAGTYTYTTTNSVGCDSVATLNLIVKENSSSVSNVSICPSALPYSWNGSRATAGTYTYTTTNSQGCDSVATLNLVVKENSSSVTNVSVCSSALPYSWNGSRTTAGTYTYTTTNSVGCDSVATLNLVVKENSSSITNESVCPSALPYNWNGSRTTAGTYTFTTTNSVGCDSVATLNLAVKTNSTSTTNVSICPSLLPYNWNGSRATAGTYTFTTTNSVGCDSVATLNLTVKENSSSVTDVSVCSSVLPYSWNGSRTTAGTYTYTTTNSVGCDSVATLNLTVKENSSSVTNVSVCSSVLPYSWNGSRTTAGTYTYTTTNSVGCDSVATLNLAVKTNSTSTTNVSICPSLLPYNWNGSRATAGTYTFTTTNSVGCDSVAILNLTVKENSSSVSNVSICPSALPYSWNGIRATAGTYTFTTTNSQGCDSIATLNLTVKTNTTSTSNVSICPSALSYNWNGSRSAAGIYTFTTTNSMGCDSVATLNLVVKENSSSVSNLSICPSALPYSWNGSRASAGTYTYTTTNSQGCDSVATLNLTVNEVTTSSTTISTCGSYTWNDQFYQHSGVYTYTTNNAVGCDSIATLYLTIKTITYSVTNLTACSNELPFIWNGLSYNQAGGLTATLTNSQGCDSMAVGVLTLIQPSTSTTNYKACSLPYTWNGINCTTIGNYTKHLINSVGCDSAAILHLSLSDLPTLESIDLFDCKLVEYKTIVYIKNTVFIDTLKTTNGCDSVYKKVNVYIGSQSVISVDKNPTCSGQIATFTSKVYNAGILVYQWYKNGVAIPNANIASYTTVGSFAGDDFQLRVRSKSSLCTINANDTTYSNVIHLVAYTTASPKLNIIASATNVCTGTNVVFTATSTNGGNSPVYTWKKNGIKVGSNSVSYSSNAIINGDVLTCEMSTGNPCATINSVVSNAIIITVNTVVNIAIAPIIGNTLICATGGATSLTETTTGGTWSSSNTSIATIGTNGLVTSTGTGSATITYNIGGVCGSSVSKIITIAPISKVLPITGNSTVCVGSSIPLANATIGTGVWSVVNTRGTITSIGLLTGTIAGGNAIVQYSVTNSAGCNSKVYFNVAVNNCFATKANNSNAEPITSKMNMYPNPSRNFVTIDNGQLIMDKHTKLFITDIAGKLVKSQTITERQTKVNTTGFKPGIYLVTILSAEGKTTEKLVVE